MTGIHTTAIVGPDGALDLHVPNLPPGQEVSITIDVEGPREASPAANQRAHPTALGPMSLPIEERHHLLARSVAEGAEAFRSDPELMEFSTLDDDEWDEVDADNAGE